MLWQHDMLFLVSCVDALGSGKVSVNPSSSYGGGPRHAGSLRSRVYLRMPTLSFREQQEERNGGRQKQELQNKTNQQDGYKFLVRFHDKWQ